MRKRPGVKKQLITYIILIFFLLLVCIGGILIPAVSVIIGIGKNIQAAREEVEQQYNKSQLLRRSIREIEEARNFGEVASAATVSPNSELTIITSLEKISDIHGVEQTLQIDKKTFGKEAATSTRPFIQTGLKDYYEVSITSQGDFPSLLEYLQDIERLPFYILIDNVSWQSNTTSETNGSTKVTLQFFGKIFITP